MKSILLNLPNELVDAVDKEATYNHLTRTGMIKRMKAYSQRKTLKAIK